MAEGDVWVDLRGAMSWDVAGGEGDDRPGHFGLHGMRERAKLVGGNLEVWSTAQSGTDIELTIPASAAYATARMSRGS